jgi:putative aldouronate transport system substrate-binding protein
VAATVALTSACGQAVPVGTGAPTPTRAASASTPASTPAANAAATPLTTAAAAASVATPGATPAATAAAPIKSGGVTLPTYLPFTGGPKPDIPAATTNLSDGYFNYPAAPFKANPGPPPGKASTITTYVGAYYPPGTTMDQNPAWQEVNRQLNASVRMDPTPLTETATKTAVMIAGGGNDLPDLLSLGMGITSINNLPQFVEATCADLTTYLSGDAIKAYPYLAAIPTLSWKWCVYNGKILAIPIARQAIYTVVYKSSLVWDNEIGAGVVPKDAADFKKILQTLTRPNDGRWGFGAIVMSAGGNPWDVGAFAKMFGAPNQYRFESGKLTHMWETDQFKAAVDYTRDLVAAGVFNPNCPNFTSVIPHELAMISGQSALGSHNMNFYNSLWRRGLQQGHPFVPRTMPAFAADGASKPVFWYGNRQVATVSIRKATPERVQELLAILNWLASPFGSQEDELLSFGIKDTDYALDDKANPVVNDRGVNDAVNIPWRYLSQRPFVIYQPDLPNYTSVFSQDEASLDPYGIEDPTLGLYSATKAVKGAQLSMAMGDALNDIVAGRRPFSDYDTAVKTYLNNGGEQIRTELLQALAA